MGARLRTSYDAVVVGGGHNGLVAAAYLAMAGQSVLVLERNEHVGGASVSEEIFPGREARLSRYSYLISLLPAKIIRDLRLDFSTRARAVRDCSPFVEDGRHSALIRWSSDPTQTRESVEHLAGRRDWDGLHQLSSLEHALAAKVWPSLLEPMRSRDEWHASLESTDERAAWDALVERPLGETLERCVQHDLLRGALMTDGKIGLFTHAHDPSLLQNRCYLLHVIGQGTGEWQVPVGGMGALVQALVERLRSCGADIATRAHVESVNVGGAKHSVAFHVGDGDAPRVVDATRVLVNAGPQVFDSLLGRSHEDAPADEGSVCKVNLLLSRLPRLRAGVDRHVAFTGTFRVNESYSELEAAYQEASAGRVPSAPPYELYCHTLTDGSILGDDLRARGFHTLTLFGLDAPYALFECDPSAADDFLERYFASLNRHLEEPIEECLATDADGTPCVEVKTPQDLEHEIALNRGNIFHRAPGWFFAEQSEDAGAWGVETQYERIYRCGASAQRGGGVSGIPGHNAAQRIFEELGIGR